MSLNFPNQFLRLLFLSCFSLVKGVVWSVLCSFDTQMWGYDDWVIDWLLINPGIGVGSEPWLWIVQCGNVCFSIRHASILKWELLLWIDTSCTVVLPASGKVLYSYCILLNFLLSSVGLYYSNKAIRNIVMK